MEDYKFDLSSPLLIHSKGEQVSAYSITCSPPSVKCKPILIRLKQMFFKSISELTRTAAKHASSTPSSPKTSSESSQADLNVSPGEILSILYMGDIDMVEFEILFKDLALRSGLKAEGENINSLHIDAMSLEDFEGLMSGYISHFLAMSWMKQLS